MADKSGKTEQPTQQRLKKAREQGQFAAAKEFVAALQFMVFLTLLSTGGADWFGRFRQTTRSILQLAFAPDLRPEALTHLAWQIFWQNILPLAMAAAGVAIATVAFRLATTQFGISFKKLMPDGRRDSPGWGKKTPPAARPPESGRRAGRPLSTAEPVRTECRGTQGPVA